MSARASKRYRSMTGTSFSENFCTNKNLYNYKNLRTHDIYLHVLNIYELP